MKTLICDNKNLLSLWKSMKLHILLSPLSKNLTFHEDLPPENDLTGEIWLMLPFQDSEHLIGFSKLVQEHWESNSKSQVAKLSFLGYFDPLMEFQAGLAANNEKLTSPFNSLYQIISIGNLLHVILSQKELQFWSYGNLF